MGEAESQSSSSSQPTSNGSASQAAEASAAPTSSQEPQPQSQEQQQQQQAAAGPKKKKWEPLQVPSPMQIVQEDAMNNCLVKGTISCVMGGLAGLAFGLFTASIENAGVSL
jgi:type IV secretory pathway VirB10-like protein